MRKRSRRAGAADMQLLWAAGAAGVLLFAVLAAGIWQFAQLQHSLERQVRLSAAAYAQRDRLLQIVNEESGVRGYVATGDPVYLQIYYASQWQWRRDAAIIQETQAVIPALQPSIGRSFAAASDLQEYFRGEIALVRAGRIQQAKRNLSKGKALFDRLRAVDAAVQQGAERERNAQRARTQLLAKGGFIASIALCAILSLWVVAFAVVVLRSRMYRLSSMRDSLTGLQNRRGAVAAIESELSVADAKPFGLVFIDLDGFKKINDVYGHATGDALLRGVGARLRAELRANDTVARLGGDEFVCIIAPPASAEHVRDIARRLGKALRRPHEIGSDTYVIGSSIGVCMYPQHGESAEALLARADGAMYAAKSAGGGVREAAAI